jgi:axial budding pattern protein 2
MTYSAPGLPSWLDFSAEQQAFYGTPAASDVGTVSVSVTAHESTGNATSAVTLVVSSDPAPTVQLGFPAQIADPAIRQLSSAQVLPGGTALSISPSWSFSLGWNWNMFAAASSSPLFVTAYARGSTTLPDWLQFSNTSYTFNGIAPWEPGSYHIIVTASDYWGYSAAETSFTLEVGVGDSLEFVENFAAIHTTAYNTINYPLGSVVVNGQNVSSSDYVISLNLTATPWLTYDKSANALIGSVPASWVNGTVAPISIPITASSSNVSNTLTATDSIDLNIVPYYFTTNQLPNTTTANGTTFAYDITPYVLNKNASYNATVTPQDAAQWLIYYPENYTLVGTPPANISYNSFNVGFFGTKGGVTGETSLHVNITGLTTNPPSGAPTPVPTGTVSHSGLSKTKKIIIGVVVGVGGFLILLTVLLFLFCCRGRSRDTKRTDNEKPALIDDLTQTPRNSVLPYIPGFGGRRHIRPDSLGVPTLTKSPAKSATDSETTCATPTTPTSKSKGTTASQEPRRIGVLTGLFPDDDAEEALQSQRDLVRDASFMGRPEAISVRRPSDKASIPFTPADVDFTSSLESGDSLESWESPHSFHWSDESEHMEPKMPGGDIAAPAAAYVPDGEEQNRPSVYPRRYRAGQPMPFISTEDLPTSHSEFSDVAPNRSSYSLGSFRGTSSQIGNDSAFGSAGQDTFNSNSRHARTDTDGSGKSALSGSSFSAPTGLGRFASSGIPSTTGTFDSEPAIVGITQRQSLERKIERPARVAVPLAPSQTQHSSAVEYVVPPRPLSVLAGPIMPSGLQPVARRNVSSSRRVTPRIHATREHIVGQAVASPIVNEQLDWTDDPFRTVRRN